MKFATSIALLLLPAKGVLASHVSGAQPVTTYLRLPFDCRNVSEQARRVLGAQCEKLAKRLEWFSIRQCQPDGDDGGYVSYFSVTAIGECQ